MSDNSNTIRQRLDALLKRARELSAEIERRVQAVQDEKAPPESSAAEGERPPEAPTPVTAGEGAPGEAVVATPAPAPLDRAEAAMAVAAEAVALSVEAAAVTAEALDTIASETGIADEVPPGPPTTAPPEAAVAAATQAPSPDTPPAGAAPVPSAEASAAGTTPAAPAPAPEKEPDTPEGEP
jgi:hypothetical protein